MIVSDASLRALALFAACLIGALTAIACGDAGSGEREAPARAEAVVLSLDFVPNAVHAPIFQAVSAGHDRSNGIAL